METLEENRIRDSPELIQPAVQDQQIQPRQDRLSNANWLSDMQEKSKNSKVKQSQETGKENQSETTNQKKNRKRVCKQATQKNHKPTPGKRKLSDDKPFWNWDNNKKARSTEKGDPAEKESLTKSFENPQTRKDQKNVENTAKANQQPKWNTKSRVITFVLKHNEENFNVEDNKPVMDYAKVKSENIILYSRKHDAIINSYVPCCALEETEKIDIIRRKQFKKKETTLCTVPHPIFDVCGEGMFFKVQCKGYTDGGGPRNILQDNKYKWKGKPLAVYGLKDQTIEEAIQNDRRFNIINEFSLKHPNQSALNKRDIRLSFLDPNVVYTVQVTNDNKSDPKIPETEGLQSFGAKAKDCQGTDNIATEVPQTSSVPQPEPKVKVPEMPEIYKTRTSTKFSSDFDLLSKKLGSKQLRQDIMRDHIKYKKPMQAATFKLLNKHLESVAMIKYIVDDSFNIGTFFLLTCNLGLTCYHVLEALLGSNPDWSTKPPLNISIIFNYDQESDRAVECRATLEYCNKELDFAFLRISTPLSAKGLLRYVTPPPEDGAVSIIGHPSGNPKQIDPVCTVINFSKRAEEIAATLLSDRSYIHVLTEYNFTLMADPELVTYDTCLYGGASGSPVFNDHGKLMAMHTGGYLARTDLEKKSIIEYGRNIIDILICGAIHIKELCEWFKKRSTLDNSLNTYLEGYTRQGGLSVKMQPIIRYFLNCLEINESPQGVNTDEIETAMDISN